MGGTFPALFLNAHIFDLGLSLFGNPFILNLNNSKQIHAKGCWNYTARINTFFLVYFFCTLV